MGSHAADELSNRGYDVTIFDREPSQWLREDQHMFLGDMLDADAISEAIVGAKHLYHFGGVADIGQSSKDPYETIKQNVMGANIAMMTVAESDVERFVYASTMYVYSRKGAFYRASKQAAETIIEAYCERYEKDYTFLRYGSLYGPRAQKWNGLRKYVEEVVRTGRLQYSGTGKERREYIHVRDAARLSVDILSEAHRNQAITVTGQQVLNSAELIDMIFEITGMKKNVKFIARGPDHDHYVTSPYHYRPKVATKLVPDQFVDLGQGVYELVDEIYSEDTR